MAMDIHSMLDQIIAESLTKMDSDLTTDGWCLTYMYMLLKYQCHINVEFIASFHTVKYVFKYVNK